MKFVFWYTPRACVTLWKSTVLTCLSCDTLMVHLIQLLSIVPSAAIRRMNQAVRNFTVVSLQNISCSFACCFVEIANSQVKFVVEDIQLSSYVQHSNLRHWSISPTTTLHIVQ